MNNPLTKWAVQYLCYQLRKDEGFWEAWQSNIAMTMYDAFQRHNTGLPWKVVHRICNIGAEDFLDLLTRPIK